MYGPVIGSVGSPINVEISNVHHESNSNTTNATNAITVNGTSTTLGQASRHRYIGRGAELGSGVLGVRTGGIRRTSKESSVVPVSINKAVNLNILKSKIASLVNAESGAPHMSNDQEIVPYSHSDMVYKWASTSGSAAQSWPVDAYSSPSLPPRSLLPLEVEDCESMSIVEDTSEWEVRMSDREATPRPTKRGWDQDTDADLGDDWGSTQATSTISTNTLEPSSSASSIVFSQQVREERDQEDHTHTFPSDYIRPSSPRIGDQNDEMGLTFEAAGTATHPRSCACHELDRDPNQSVARLEECTQLVKILLSGFSSNRSHVLIKRLKILSFVKQQLTGTSRSMPVPMFPATITDQLLTAEDSYYEPFYADAYSDALLYNHGWRNDMGLYFMLYGIDPLRVQWLDACGETIQILNTYATNYDYRSRLQPAFSSFIALLQACSFREPYRDPTLKGYARRFWDAVKQLEAMDMGWQ